MPIPTRYFREASSVDLPTSVRYGVQTLGVLARFARRPAPPRRWPLLRRRRAAIWGAHAPVRDRASDPPAWPPYARLPLALVLRLAYVDDTPGYVLRHDAGDYDVHAARSPRATATRKTLAYGRPTAFRPPGYPYFLGAVYQVFG